MKKILVILLAVISIFALVACGQREKLGPEYDEQIISGAQTPNPWVQLNSYEEAKAKNSQAPDLSEYGCYAYSYSYDESDDILDINFVVGEFIYGFVEGSDNPGQQTYCLRIAKDDGISTVRELSGYYYNFVDDNGIYPMLGHISYRMVANNSGSKVYLNWFEDDGYYFILSAICEGEFVNPLE